MKRRLVENITSEYMEAYSVLNKRNRVMVYVEGYDDIPFWRLIFDEFETKDRHFEVSTPSRRDLAKGKKVVLKFAPQAGKNLILCVDSDFDYLSGDFSFQSRMVNQTPYLLQTYTYSVENYLCYPPSLHSLCVRATKKDIRIFDFERFMSEYSKIIYPVFVWYAYAARNNRTELFTLSDFRGTVKLNFVKIEDNGESTLEWLKRRVDQRLSSMKSAQKRYQRDLETFKNQLTGLGVVPENTHLYMQGHTLLDNVVSMLLETVCNAQRKIAVGQILGSTRQGLTLNNELSSYNNVVSDVEVMLKTNVGYRSCPLFVKLRGDIVRMLEN